MTSIEEMKLIGQQPKRVSLIVKPVRWIIFPFIRAYLQYIIDCINNNSQKVTAVESQIASQANHITAVESQIASQASYIDTLETKIVKWITFCEQTDISVMSNRLSLIEDNLREKFEIISQDNQNIIHLGNKLSLIEDNLREKFEFISQHNQDIINRSKSLIESNKTEKSAMISYAQNHEDVLLERIFKEKTNGFYIDIGAALPVEHSVTYHFYKKGWKGINVEPLPHFFTLLSSQRSRDINLCCAVGNTCGTSVFYEVSNNIGRSSLDQSIAKQVENAALIQHDVSIITLNEIYSQYQVDQVDFLKIDVEGGEYDVIISNDWIRNRPRVVIVEAIHPTTYAPQWDSWENILLSHDYIFVNFDGLNRYYLRKEDAELEKRFQSPVNILDNYVPYSLYQATQILNSFQTE